MDYTIQQITGRFMNFDETTLRQIRSDLKAILKKWGAMGPEDFPDIPVEPMPLWAEVEFLDNIVQFELENNPFLHSELQN